MGLKFIHDPKTPIISSLKYIYLKINKIEKDAGDALDNVYFDNQDDKDSKDYE